MPPPELIAWAELLSRIGKLSRQDCGSQPSGYRLHYPGFTNYQQRQEFVPVASTRELPQDTPRAKPQTSQLEIKRQALTHAIYMQRSPLTPEVRIITPLKDNSSPKEIPTDESEHLPDRDGMTHFICIGNLHRPPRNGVKRA